MKTSTIIISIIVSVIILIVLVVGAYNLMQPSKNTNQKNTQQQTPANFDIRGMKVEVLKQGTGEGAKVGDRIVVNYVGTLTNGTKFDSSIDRKHPFPYTLGKNQVIRGWELGILGMKIGEKRKLTIPPSLAYGDAGRPPIIPKSATLIFEIDMLSIN